MAKKRRQRVIIRSALCALRYAIFGVASVFSYKREHHSEGRLTFP
jgi:hypothetical protein